MSMDISTDHKPRVSVVMPLFNALPYLAEAMESILSQTLRDIELIVVDDGSTDGSAALAMATARRDPRVRVLLRPHAGVEAVNVGVAAARAKYIARMDADDIAISTRLERQAAFLDAQGDCVAVGSWLERTDPFGSPAGLQETPVDHETIDGALIRGEGWPIVQGTTMYRKSALRAAGGWRADFGWVEDLDLFLRLAEVGRLANIPEVLYRYRRHPKSVCPSYYASMCERIADVVAAAYRRRGLGDPPAALALRPDLPKKHSTAELYRNWACHAIHRRRPRLARWHAAQALWREPWRLHSWRVLAWSVRCEGGEDETRKQAA